MDYDNLQQNVNTRVVFKEPRGMVRWLQLFFGIVAFSTVVDFKTFVGLDVVCPPVQLPTPAPAPTPANTNVTAPPAPPLAQANATTFHVQYNVTYPFEFSQQVLPSPCPNSTGTYKHLSSLSGSPQFFVMTGVLSLIYASASLLVYLLFSSTYESVPVVPVADLIITAILCLFWFIASSSFSSGASLLKSTVSYAAIEQAICHAPITCTQNPLSEPAWRSINVGLVSGFTSFFLWGTGIWFVFKETHFHTPRDQFGPR